MRHKVDQRECLSAIVGIFRVHAVDHDRERVRAVFPVSFFLVGHDHLGGIARLTVKLVAGGCRDRLRAFIGLSLRFRLGRRFRRGDGFWRNRLGRRGRFGGNRFGNLPFAQVVQSTGGKQTQRQRQERERDCAAANFAAPLAQPDRKEQNQRQHGKADDDAEAYGLRSAERRQQRELLRLRRVLRCVRVLLVCFRLLRGLFHGNRRGFRRGFRRRGRVHVSAELRGVDVLEEIAAGAIVANRGLFQQKRGGERQLGFVGMARGAKREHIRRKRLHALALHAVERRAVVQLGLAA